MKTFDLADTVRPAAVLFVDLAGSVGLTHALSPLEAARYLNSALVLMIELCVARGGTIIRCFGDGLLAVFAGAHHGEDCVNAVFAASDVRERLQRAGVRVHAGVNHGEVYLGTIGSALYHEYSVMGPVVDIAARLQSIAPPGSIFVGPAVYKLAREPFSFVLRTTTIRGIPWETAAYEVCGPHVPPPSYADQLADST